MSGSPVFCTPLNTPPDFHSLWGWLDSTQTCLARRRIFLTGGLTSPISRAATAHSEWTSPHKLAAGGELERTGGKDAPLKMVQHRPLTADFKDPVMNMTGSQRNSLWIQCTFLSRLYGLFRSDFFFFLVAPGIWFDCTSRRWHGNSRRSLLDVEIYGTCIFMSAWCYSTWQLLILKPLIPEEF